MGATSIEYVTTSWNPVSGCTPVSAGCANCYAARMARRFPQTHAGWLSCNVCQGTGRQSGEAIGERLICPGCNGTGGRRPPFSAIRLHPDRLSIPRHWRKPRVVLVPSMGDLFHEDVPDEFLCNVFGVMNSPDCRHHTFLVLTKRAERARDLMRRWAARPVGNYPLPTYAFPWPPPNVWLGGTICNQEEADRIVPIVLDTPAAHRWVSAVLRVGIVKTVDRIEWVVAGCESGPGRRPAKADWFRSLRDQCVEAGVPFFLKQMAQNEDGTGKVVKMPELDDRVWAQTPWGRSDHER